MPKVVNLLPKLRGYSVKISTTTALALHCAWFCSCLYSASPFTLLYSTGVPRYPQCPHSSNGERSVRPEMLHVSDQQESVGPWGGLCWGGRSHKVGWSRRRARSCCNLLQGMTFSQASDQLESDHEGEEREKFPAHMPHL